MGEVVLLREVARGPTPAPRAALRLADSLRAAAAGAHATSAERAENPVRPKTSAGGEWHGCREAWILHPDRRAIGLLGYWVIGLLERESTRVDGRCRTQRH